MKKVNEFGNKALVALGVVKPTSSTPTATVANDASGLTETQAPTSPELTPPVPAVAEATVPPVVADTSAQQADN